MAPPHSLDVLTCHLCIGSDVKDDLEPTQQCDSLRHPRCASFSSRSHTLLARRQCVCVTWRSKAEARRHEATAAAAALKGPLLAQAGGGGKGGVNPKP